jgi:hypothetical protein
VDGEDIRSSGLVNGRLMMEYTPRCRGVQVDREPDDGLSRRVFESFLTARMGVSVGRLPQEVPLEESYRSERSETVRVGRVRVLQEFPTVFNCSVLTFWSAIKFHCEIEPTSTLQYLYIYKSECVCVCMYVCMFHCFQAA